MLAHAITVEAAWLSGFILAVELQLSLWPELRKQRDPRMATPVIFLQPCPSWLHLQHRPHPPLNLFYFEKEPR